jgi:IS30 family transposase
MQAHQFALNKRNKAKYHIEVSTWLLIELLISQNWSIEQVSSWVKENFGLQIRHEWINDYILMDKDVGGDLHLHLRFQSKIITREKV